MPNIEDGCSGYGLLDRCECWWQWSWTKKFVLLSNLNCGINFLAFYGRNNCKMGKCKKKSGLVWKSFSSNFVLSKKMLLWIVWILK